MNRRRQALQFCLDPAIVAVVQTGNQFLLEMLRRLKLLQIQKFTLEKPKEILDHSIVRTISFTAHALPDALLPEHPTVVFVLVLPTLVRVQNQICILLLLIIFCLR